MLPFIIYIMELNIKTKFDVGQKVYIYQKDIAFRDGDFISVYTPDPTPYQITSIRTHTYNDYQSIYYRLDGHKHSFREDKLFESLEDMK